jgi:hypothetical protein
VSTGWYKRRRGILEHIDSGIIDLLESGIHDYLSLKANLLIGSPCSIPVGVVFTSAPAIHVHCHRVSERTIQRCLEHMEAIGWLKFSTWRTNGKRGNYAVLLCRGSVHDLSGNEYRINGEKTTDWRLPVYEPFGEVSGSALIGVVTLSGNREVRSEEARQEEKSKAKPAAKTTQAADLRYQPFVDFAYRSFEAKHRQKPTWSVKDFNGLKALLKRNQTLAAAELERRWQHYSGSTEPFTAKQGDSLAYFCAKFDSFIDGPILGTTGGKADGKAVSGHQERQKRTLEARDRALSRGRRWTDTDRPVLAAGSERG